MIRALWLALIAFVVSGLLAVPVWAVEPPAQFAAALQAGEAALAEVRSALEAESPSLARARLTNTRASLLQMKAALEQVESSSTDDAIRSRAHGLLDHVNAALRAVALGLAGPDDQVASRADAARGEIEEALSELRPEVGAPAPAELPQAGDVTVNNLLPYLAAAGLLLLTGGLLLRRV